MVFGQRQVGKSTMLNHIKEESRRYVSFDDRAARRLAETDPSLFLKHMVAQSKLKKVKILSNQIKTLRYLKSSVLMLNQD